jgi:hypothetical protein
VSIADFGTDYTGIGWLTVVLPLALLAGIVVWWRLSWRRGGSPEAPEQPAPAAKAGAKAGGKKSATQAVVPILPAFRVLPVGVAIALTLAVVVLWLWHGTRRAQS